MFDSWLNQGHPLGVFTVLADHASGDDWLAKVKGSHQGVWVLAIVDRAAAEPADRLRAHPLVSQCIVVGDKKPFIGVLIALDAQMFPAWARNHKLPNLSMEDARTNDVVRAELQRAVDNANKSVSRPESIRKFMVLAGDFTEENGCMTPSLKLRRNVVMKEYAAEVEALYSGPRE